MTDAAETCEACGRPVRIGDFPFCPHGPAHVVTVPDDVPGGFVVENGFDTERKFYSRSEHLKALAAEGKELRVKWSGEHERHLTRWDTVDLEAAATLVQRGAQAREARQRRRYAVDVAPEDRFPVTITKTTPYPEP